jgi:hypothetical protein
MARRKSSHRRARTRTRARRTKHNRRRHTRRVRRIRRGGAPYAATRMMPLNQEQTLDGRNFSRPHQIGGTGVLQPSGSKMVVGGSNGQMATNLPTGGRG